MTTDRDFLKLWAGLYVLGLALALLAGLGASGAARTLLWVGAILYVLLCLVPPVRAAARRRVWGAALRRMPYQPPLPIWMEATTALAYVALLMMLGLPGIAVTFLAGDLIQALYILLFLDLRPPGGQNQQITQE